MAIALAAAVLPATDAPADTAPSSGFAGAAQVLRTSGYPIVSRGNFGWQSVCPNTGPTRR